MLLEIIFILVAILAIVNLAIYSIVFAALVMTIHRDAKGENRIRQSVTQAFNEIV